MAEASRPSPKSAASDPDSAVDRPGAPDGGRSPGNLPLELSSFVGRPREIAEVERLLRNTRLLTLTGPGGSGKTRLALAVGSGSGDDYEDGVWVTKSPTAHFEFASSDPAATFECGLDGGVYYPCSSPENINHLSEGRHVFEVRAVNGEGADQSPALWAWTVDRKQ